uniref:RNase H type-1 domain-containing protein n=1 Tax=Aegilops tauschii subsp. strangulata TaxID=200361 RepID=A0A452Y732_AEGTS
MGLVSLSRLYQGPLIIETDNKMVANELGQARSNRSRCFWVVCEIKNTSRVFSSVRAKAIIREQNCLAHELAAKARWHEDSLIIADVPEELRSLMLSECTK